MHTNLISNDWTSTMPINCEQPNCWHLQNRGFITNDVPLKKTLKKKKKIPSAISLSLDFPVHFFITQPSLGLKVALMWKASVYHASGHTVTTPWPGPIPPWGWWLCSNFFGAFRNIQKSLIYKTYIHNHILFIFGDDSFFGIPRSFSFFFRFPEKKWASHWESQSHHLTQSQLAVLDPKNWIPMADRKPDRRWRPATRNSWYASGSATRSKRSNPRISS